jgi:hypothetical protein
MPVVFIADSCISLSAALAPVLASALQNERYPQLLPTVCNSLQVLVRSVHESGEGSLWPHTLLIAWSSWALNSKESVVH